MYELVLFLLVVVILLFGQTALKTLNPKYRMVILILLFSGLMIAFWVDGSIKTGIKIVATLLFGIAFFIRIRHNYKLLKS